MTHQSAAAFKMMEPTPVDSVVRSLADGKLISFDALNDQFGRTETMAELKQAIEQTKQDMMLGACDLQRRDLILYIYHYMTVSGEKTAALDASLMAHDLDIQNPCRTLATRHARAKDDSAFWDALMPLRYPAKKESEARLPQPTQKPRLQAVSPT